MIYLGHRFDSGGLLAVVDANNALTQIKGVHNMDVEKIMAYEAGEMDDEEMIEFFQGLIDTGMAWTLQGHYGQMATTLIEAGYCTRK